MKNNDCTCVGNARDCTVHRKRNVRRDFYKYEDDYRVDDDNYDENDEK